MGEPRLREPQQSDLSAAASYSTASVDRDSIEQEVSLRENRCLLVFTVGSDSSQGDSKSPTDNL